MDTHNLAWLGRRLQRISDFFHAVKILDPSELFRSWDLPDGSTAGIMGRFAPAIPLTRPELDARAVHDIHRFTRPYVRWHVLVDKFGGDAEFVSRKFFNVHAADLFIFKDEYNTEAKIRRAVDAEFADDSRRHHFEVCLRELLSSVLLIADRNHADCYHVRGIPTVDHYELWAEEGWVARPSWSWMELGASEKAGFLQIADDYRSGQRFLWTEKGVRRLRILKGATNLAVSVDFTAVTAVSDIQQTGFVPVRIERIPRDRERQIDSVHSFEYLSECVTSTPFLPTLRGWWEQEVRQVAEFWRSEFGRWDHPWRCFAPWIASSIVERCLWSRSMWVTFLLQDLTAVAEHLQHEGAREARMIDPASNEVYRLPFTVEFLGADARLVHHVRRLARESRRL
jgi:4-alpha-glucanotransferase